MHRILSTSSKCCRVQESSWEDKGLGILAAAISIAIMAILGRKALYIAGIDIYDFF